MKVKNLFYFKYYKKIIFIKIKMFIIICDLIFYGDWGLGIGDWGVGIGDWGLGPIPNPQSPIPNPQSPIPISLYFYFKLFIYNYDN